MKIGQVGFNRLLSRRTRFHAFFSVACFLPLLFPFLVAGSIAASGCRFAAAKPSGYSLGHGEW
jgi:hypothetical protein